MHCCWCGDLNSCIGDTKLKLSFPGYFYRQNPDKVTNSHGDEMINICKSFKCFFLNNLTKGDVEFDGDFTFVKGNRKSQNDILVANINGLKSVDYFKIHNDIVWNPSDHSPLNVNLSVMVVHKDTSCAASADILTTAGEPKMTREKSVYADKVNWKTYNELTSANFKYLMNDLNKCMTDTNLSNINHMVDNINASLLNAAMVSKTLNTDNIAGIPEIDENIMTCAMIDSSIKTKQANMWREILISKDSKCLWNRIDWNGSSIHNLEEYPDIDDLVTHFQEKGQATDNSTLLCEINGNKFVPELDGYITRNELGDAINKLKVGKSTGDGWAKFMLTELNACFLLLFTTLLNIIFRSHQYPTQ